MLVEQPPKVHLGRAGRAAARPGLSVLRRVSGDTRVRHGCPHASTAAMMPPQPFTSAPEARLTERIVSPSRPQGQGLLVRCTLSPVIRKPGYDTANGSITPS